MLAAGKNDAYGVKLLVEAGAHVNLVAKNGLSALHYALENGGTETVLLLKRAGAR
jgi:ankyrin repeat protein